MSFKESTKHLFDKIFHDRKIVLISDEKMSTIKFTKKLQMISAAAIVLLAIGFPYITGKVVGLGHFANNQEEIYENVDTMEGRVALLERNLEVLEQYLNALYKNGVFTVKKEEYHSKPPGAKDKLTELEIRKNKLIYALHENTYDRIKKIENVLGDTGVSYSQLTGKKAPDTSKGGPYIAAKSLDFTENSSFTVLFNEDFINNFVYLYDLQEIVYKMPFSSPMDGPRITSRFGFRRDPFHRKLAMHSGLDMASKTNPNVHATSPGTVTYAGRKGAYGLTVELRHSDDVTTRYAHLKEIRTQVGQRVRRGEVVGIQGSTGRSTGDHLHYEVRYKNKPLNPVRFLKQAYRVDYHDSAYK